MRLKKNIKVGKINFLIFLTFLIIIIFTTTTRANQEVKNLEGEFIELKILDKVSSKTSQLSLNIDQDTKFENLVIKILKCKNSEFDDNPEVTAYMQVKDITLNNNDQVFVFNGWTFSSSPSISLFDHPVYDIWLIKCY